MKTYFNLKLIEEYMEKEKIDKKEFCKRAGISIETLMRIYTKTGRYTVHTWHKIIVLLGVRARDLHDYEY